MNLLHIVAVLSIAQFLFFGALVGRARGRYGIKAPAVGGHEGFDRMFRVQMNTLSSWSRSCPRCSSRGSIGPTDGSRLQAWFI